jgi:hypothetical protein
MIEDFRTSLRLVLAGVFHLSSQILYSQVSGVYELLSAAWTVAKFLLADFTDLMTICTQCDRRPQVLQTHRTLQANQEALF